MLSAAEYGELRDTRIHEHDLNTSDIYSLLLRLSDANCDAVQVPASVQQIDSTRIGSTPLSIKILNIDFIVTHIKYGSIHDGIWLPNANSKPRFNGGHANEGYLITYNDGMGFDALLATAGMQRELAHWP